MQMALPKEVGCQEDFFHLRAKRREEGQDRAQEMCAETWKVECP